VEAKPINDPFYFKSIKNKNDSDQLEHRVEELASIAAITREVTSKLSMKQMIASTHKQIHIAICLHNSLLYERIQEHADELEKLLQEKKQANKALKNQKKELKLNTKKQEEVNTALKVLLKQRDQDKTEIEEKVIFNVKELVLPYLEKLKAGKLSSQ
jgi:hypothetical protein